MRRLRPVSSDEARQVLGMRKATRPSSGLYRRPMEELPQTIYLGTSGDRVIAISAPRIAAAADVAIVVVLAARRRRRITTSGLGGSAAITTLVTVFQRR